MVAIRLGFTRQQKLLVVGCAIFAVLVSLAFAAWIMEDARRSMQFSQQDQEIVNRLSGETADPLHQSILRAHAIDAVANLKQSANRQSIIIVAFAGAFALSIFGFALFLLGADSVFQLQAEQGRSGLKLWLAGTAPGILCFALAVILVGMAIAHRPSVNLASAYFPKQPTRPSEISVAPGPDAARNAAAQKAQEAAEQRIAAQEAQNRAAEKAAAAKLAAEKAATDQLMADQLAAAKAAAEKAAIARQAAEKAVADKLAAEKLAAEKAANARQAAEKAVADKLAAERAAENKLAAAKAAEKTRDATLAAAKAAAAAKLAADRVAADRLAVDRARADKAGADKAAADKLAAAKVASNKLAADKLASDVARTEKTAAGQVDVANLTAERIAAAGAPSEVYKRALALRNAGETNQALALLRYASSAGHGPSSRLLAAIYRDGAPDVRANFRQAEKYQLLADAQGDR